MLSGIGLRVFLVSLWTTDEHMHRNRLCVAENLHSHLSLDRITLALLMEITIKLGKSIRI